MRKITIALLAAFTVLALALFVLPNLISWNVFKPEIEAAVRKATGRDFEIGGDIDVSLFPGLHFGLSQVRLGNAPNMSTQSMVSLPSLVGRLEIWPLLFGRLAIGSLLVENPTLNLEINEAGVANWSFDRSGTSSGSRVSPFHDLHLADVRIADGLVTYTNAQTQQSIEGDGLQLEITLADLHSPLSIVVRSVINGEEVALKALVKTPGAVVGGRTAELEANLESEQVTFKLDSRIAQNPVFAVDGNLELQVVSVGALAAWLDRPLRDDPGPLVISAKVKHDGTKTVLEEASVKGTDLAVNTSGSMERSGAATKLSLKLESDSVDLDRYRWAQPRTGRKKNRESGEPRENVSLLDRLSAEPLDLQPLHRFDVDMVANVAGIKSSGVHVGPIAFEAKTQDGQLDVALSKLDLYGGTVSGTLHANGLRDELSVSTDLDLTSVDVEALAQALEGRGLPMTGIANAKLEVGTRGASSRELARSLLGEVTFKLSDGKRDKVSTGLVSAVSAKLHRKTLTGPLKLDAELVYSHEKVDIDVTVSDVADLLERETFALDGTLKSALGTAGYQGSVLQQPLPSFDGNLDLNVPSVGRLAAWLGRPVRNDPGPLTVKAELESDGVRGKLRTLSLEGTDLSAEATGAFDFSGKVPQVSLKVKGSRLDIDRYLPPQENAQESTKQPQAKTSNTLKDYISTLSTEPLDLAPLRTIAADVVIALEGLRFSAIEVAPLEATVKLKEGVLGTKLSEFGLFDGRGAAELSLDTGGGEVAFEATAALNNAQAHALNEWLDLEAVALAGPTEAKLKLSTRGQSPIELLAGLIGELELAGGGLRVPGTTGPFRVSGQLGGSSKGLALSEAHASVGLGSTQLAVTGGIEDLVSLRSIDLKLASSGDNLGALGTLVALELPPTDSFDFEGRLTGSGRLLALEDARLLLTQGDTQLKLVGKIEELLDLSGIDLGLAAASESLADLGAPLGADLPDLGPIEVIGQLTGAREALVVDNLLASIDRSELIGTAKLELRKQPKITLRLKSTLLDFSPFLGKAKADEKAVGQDVDSHRYLESRDPLPFDVLSAVDADVALDAKHIRVQDAMLEFGKLSLRLEEGMLHLDKVEAEYKKVKLQGSLDIETGTQTLVTSKFLVQGFDLGRFLRESNINQEIDTKVDLAADLKSRGDSPHALAANLEGSIGAVFGPGYFSHYLDLLAGGLTRQVGSFWGQHKQGSELECAVILFDIAEGVETSHAFFFETKRSVLKGKGQVNLGTGALNFMLTPKPKDLSLVSLATKLRVTGSVWHPKVTPTTEDLLLKGVKALSALAVGPAGLLAPFLHLGAHEPHPCDLKSREHQILNVYP